jgi:hypothetical protein
MAALSTVDAGTRQGSKCSSLTLKLLMTETYERRSGCFRAPIGSVISEPVPTNVKRFHSTVISGASR